jgi:dUTP pyrophosphatase
MKNDIEDILKTDERQKKAAGRGVYHKAHGGKVHFPSDNLTQAQIDKLSGEVKTYNLKKPLTWAEFEALPVDLKKEYIRKAAKLMTNIHMKIKLDPGAYMPERAFKHDGGLDIRTPVSFSVPAGGQVGIDTGVHVAIPAGYVGLLTSKSGLMLKGVTSRGTIDSGFTGAITAVLFNHGQSDIVFQKGQKITQLVIVPILAPELDLVAFLDETDRGRGGFGSTGE